MKYYLTLLLFLTSFISHAESIQFLQSVTCKSEGGANYSIDKSTHQIQGNFGGISYISNAIFTEEKLVRVLIDFPTKKEVSFGGIAVADGNYGMAVVIFKKTSILNLNVKEAAVAYFVNEMKKGIKENVLCDLTFIQE